MQSTGKITKQLNITRTTLYRMLIRYNISPITTTGGHYRISSQDFETLKEYCNIDKTKKKQLILLKNQIKKRVKEIYDDKMSKKILNEINVILDHHFNRLNTIRLNDDFRL